MNLIITTLCKYNTIDSLFPYEPSWSSWPLNSMAYKQLFWLLQLFVLTGKISFMLLIAVVQICRKTVLSLNWPIVSKDLKQHLSLVEKTNFSHFQTSSPGHLRDKINCFQRQKNKIVSCNVMSTCPLGFFFKTTPRQLDKSLRETYKIQMKIRKFPIYPIVSLQ